MTKRHRSIWRRLQSGLFYGLGLAVFVLFLYITVWGQDGLKDLFALRRKQAQIRASHHKILEENLRYIKEIQKLKQLRYVEQRARSDLGLLHEKEFIYVLPRTP